MSGVNPFLVLGLSESILRSVSEKDILALAQSQYRALSRIFHPDMGGDAAIFAFITEAYESIQDDEERKEYIDDYLISRADKLTHARQELVELGKKNLEELNQASLAYENFFKKFGRGYQSNEPLPLNSRDVTLVFQDTVSNPDMYKARKNDFALTESYMVLRRVNGLVSIARLVYTGYAFETVFDNTQYLRSLGKNTKGKTVWDKHEQATSGIGKVFNKKISDLENAAELSKEDKKELNELNIRSNNLVIRYFFEELKPKKTDLFLLGSYEDEGGFDTDLKNSSKLPNEPDSKHTPIGQLLLEAPVSAKSTLRPGVEFDHSDFAPMLVNLKNNFDEKNLLVAASLDENDALRYIVLGQIHPHLTQQAQEKERGGK